MDPAVAAAIQEIQGISEMLLNDSDRWDDYLVTARRAILVLDNTNIFSFEDNLSEQIWVLNTLQDLAFHDADNGFITDVAEWVDHQWLRVLSIHPDDPYILAGLGKHWYQRAQPSLVTVHEEEGSASSGSGSAGTPATAAYQSHAYVEARGLLRPSVDFFTRAVRAASLRGEPSGELLALTAESYMSLGNVTAPPANEELFIRAVRYLRRARNAPGYELNEFHQQYLEEYGRYVQ